MCLSNKTEYSSEQIIRFIKTKKEKFWLKVKEERAFEIFKWAAKNISAYGNFLKKNKLDPNEIKNYEDFKSLPLTSKKKYLNEYDLEKLSCGCFLNKETIFTATSGSTGAPFYFPRGNNLDWQNSVINELFFKNGFKKEPVPTLVIVGFGMGVWIGGLITYSAFDIIAKNGYPISIITPGTNKQEIFSALKSLSLQYKQTILTGYPPFIKDIIDEAPGQGIDLKKINLRLLFAAESFTEKFRDYLVKKTGIKNLYLDTLNIYGSADIGTMAFETPLSILVRRFALKKKELFRALFSDINKTPTLAQYIPHFINFEEISDKKILLTGDSIVPLVRYDIGDHGGVLTLSEIKEKFKKYGIDLIKEAKKAGIGEHIYELPFVYVYERADFAVKLRLHDIYPEFIKDVLMQKEIEEFLTGKFQMETKYNKQQNQYLKVNLEMKKNKNINDALRKKVYKEIESSLCSKSSGPGGVSEFKKGGRLLRLFFWSMGYEKYFKPGAKQKWVAKENLTGAETEKRILKPRVRLSMSRFRIKKVIRLSGLKSKIKVAA